MKNYAETFEAQAIRAQRRLQRRDQRDDPLAKRARLIAFWRECSETNPAYRPHNGCWWWVFTWNRSFRDLLMPKLRARQDARDRAHRESYVSELRESGRQWAQKKAERAAIKARAQLPQLDLLDAVD